MAKEKSKKKSIKDQSLYRQMIHFDSQLFDENFNKINQGYETPDYILQNMKHHFRYYQADAFRFYHYLLTEPQFSYHPSRQILFNMATGSGKTDLMAGLILYLYQEHGYQHFLFTVNTHSVLQKTIDNLTTIFSEKYLYAHSIEIEGERIRIEQVDQFPTMPRKNTIYLKLGTIQGIASDLFTEKENSMGIGEYEKQKTVILADEAHHYSASTKKEKEHEKSWERTIALILDAHEDNRLLEFTATMDLNNKNVVKKYRDKVIYRYTLDRYIYDGYSKNIRRIQSSNTDLDNILNVILLSEFRRRYAKEVHHAQIKPVILFKSPRIKDSIEAEEKFHDLIEHLTASQLLNFVKARYHDQTEEHSETLYRTYGYYLANEYALTDIVREMKRQFSPTRVINANSQNMLDSEQYEALNTLESPMNLYRVVFAVAKLTEGWDVLNLYDIVRISDTPAAKGTKNSTNTEAQLIGRGARYNPFIVDGEKSYTRRFEDGQWDNILLETLHYHTINEPQYLKNLLASLDEMNLPTGEDKKNPLINVKVKESFKKTKLYQSGYIYYNQASDVADAYYDHLAKYGIDNQNDIYIEWKLATKELDYSSEFTVRDYENVQNIAIELDQRLIYKAMNRLSFYHFDRLKEYLPLLGSRKEFLGEKWLNLHNRTLYATAPITITSRSLTPASKLEIFEIYLLQLEKEIKHGYLKRVGTNAFIGYPIREYIADYNKRIPNYDTSRIKLHSDQVPQHVSRKVYDDDFFVYDSAIINQTEGQLVDRIDE